MLFMATLGIQSVNGWIDSDHLDMQLVAAGLFDRFSAGYQARFGEPGLRVLAGDVESVLGEMHDEAWK